MKVNVPKEIIDVITKLNTVPNTTSLVVGGAVRDAILGKEPHDWDVSTNVPMEKIEEMFETYDIGSNKDFGIVVVNTPIGGVEIAQFRTDGDTRFDNNVKFVSDFKTDSERRDFTVNAMGYDPVKDEIIDFHGGIEDIKTKTLRFVGNADERIKEDPLRMIRAIRFNWVKGFSMNAETRTAIRKKRKLIRNVSIERIFSEIEKVAETNDVDIFADFIGNFRKLFFDIVFDGFGFDTFTFYQNYFKKGAKNIKPSDFMVAFFSSFDSRMEFREVFELPISNDVKDSVKFNWVNDFSEWDFDNVMTDFDFFDKVFTSKFAKTTFRDWIVNVRGIDVEKYDARMNKMEKFKDIKKKYNGNFIMETFGVKGKFIGQLQREIIKAVIDSNN